MDKTYKKEKPDLDTGDIITINLNFKHTINAYVETVVDDHLVVREIVDYEIKGDPINILNYKEHEYWVQGENSK